MKKLGSIFALAVAALAIEAGSVEAGYPPGPPTPPAGELPATGPYSAPIAEIAAGLVAVGTGMVVVAGVRRRKAAA